MDTWCCFVSRSRWTKKLQLTVLAFTCVTCNNTNSVGLFRYGLSHHKVISSLHRFQPVEHDLYGLLQLQTGNDDDGGDMPGMNSVSAKVDVGGSALEGAPTTLSGPSDLDTKKPPTRASLKMAEKLRMA
ncbi:hypothetical protein Bca4012_000895 [Brassica carinata]